MNKILIFLLILSTHLNGKALPPFTQLPEESDQVNIEQKISYFDKDQLTSAEGLYEYARLQILASDFNSARESLNLALKLDPDFVQAKIQLGYLDLWENNFEDAFIIFESVDRADPCSRLIWEGLELIALKWENVTGRQQDALNIYNRLIQCMPNNCDWLYYKGRLLKKTGRFSEAETYLKQAVELCPEYSDELRGEDVILTPLTSITETKAPPPITEKPEEVEDVTDQLHLIKQESDRLESSADLNYRIGRLYIKACRFSLARDRLCQAQSLDPNFVYAKIQLAYLDLWEGLIDRAHSAFANIETSSQEWTWDGLEQVAHVYRRDPSRYQTALMIYNHLLSYQPENCDWLFYKGTLLAKMGSVEESNAALSMVLCLCPDYSDALLAIAGNYLSLGCYYPAATYFVQALLDDPCQTDARKAIAYVYERLRYYSLSKSYYLNLICEQPCDYDLANYYYYQVKPFTDISISPEWIYVNSKEEDPSLDRYVVKTLYEGGNLNFIIPLSDCLLFDGKMFYFHQKEKNIIEPEGTNYSAYYSGAQISSHYYFKTNWRWNFTLRGLYAWGSDEDVLFPFAERGSFEPGTSVVYDDRRSFFSIGSYFESFLTKNFDTQEAELFNIWTNEARFGMRWIESPCIPQIWAWATVSNYRGERYNWRHGGAFLAQSAVPFCLDLRLSYLFDIGHFERLTRNYYSYNKQYLHILGAEYYKEFGAFNLNLRYQQRFREARDVFLPVGDDVFIADKLSTTAYNPSITLGYRCGLSSNIELYGHYYYDTFKYYDWKMAGSWNYYF